MMNKIKLAVAGIVPTLSLLAMQAHAQISTTTLGTSIDDVNSTFYDYFVVLLDKYWPFVVGAGILVAVWHYGRRLLTAFN